MNKLDNRVRFNAWFRKAAAKDGLAGWGLPGPSVLALACVLVWASLGPYSRYSDTWQLIINTANYSNYLS